MYRTTVGFVLVSILPPAIESSIIPIIYGTTSMGRAAPLCTYIHAAEVSVMESRNLLLATAIFRRAPYHQVQDRNICPSCSEAEHAGMKTDNNKSRKPLWCPVYLQVHFVAAGRFVVNAVYPERC